MSINIGLSPLQTRQLLFTKVLVEPYSFGEDAEIWAPGYDFSNVNVQTSTTVGLKEGEKEDPRNYLITVRVSILNEKDKPAPYTVDVEAQAWIELQPVFDIEKRESIMAVNGPTVVIGAIRELITQISARSLYGSMILPTLRFHNGEHEG